MSKTHSPGPWHTNAKYPNLVNGPENAPGVLVNCSQYVDEPEAYANAKLIAAAPELLHELYTALPFVEDAEDDPAYKTGAVKKVLASIRAVLAKADARLTEGATYTA